MAENSGNAKGGTQRLEQKTIQGQVITHTIVKPTAEPAPTTESTEDTPEES
ncbi:hypothetical protein [Streptomyces sp. NPDC056492]|uniref:hypothetical protein n=1 Tax=unclassified Streptomyces TaxID=2593676 RepID=UPI0036C6C919